MKHPKLIIFTFALILFYAALFRYVPDKSLSKVNETAPISKLLNSDIYKFSVTIPPGLANTGDELTIELSESNKKIFISRTGSIYNNVNEYFNNLVFLNKLNVKQITPIKLNNYEVIQTKIIRSDNSVDIVYFLYVDSYVYNFRTTSPELYDELEQVVQSFEYTGE